MQRLKIWDRNGDKALLHNFSIRIGMSFILTLLYSNSLLMTASASSGKVSCNTKDWSGYSAFCLFHGFTLLLKPPQTWNSIYLVIQGFMPHISVGLIAVQWRWLLFVPKVQNFWPSCKALWACWNMLAYVHNNQST